jgi:hypothetical protein
MQDNDGKAESEAEIIDVVTDGSEMQTEDAAEPETVTEPAAEDATEP